MAGAQNDARRLPPPPPPRCPRAQCGQQAQWIHRRCGEIYGSQKVSLCPCLAAARCHRHDAPLAELRLAYRDLRTLRNRGIVPKTHAPDPSLEHYYIAAAGGVAAAAAAGGETSLLNLSGVSGGGAFKPGEIVDLT